MAYISQELKKTLTPAIKSVLAKYGMKGTVGIQHHDTLVVTIKSGTLDLIGNHVKYSESVGRQFPDGIPTSLSVDQHYAREVAVEDIFDETVKNFYDELFVAIKGDTWFDKSNIKTDCFNTEYYIDVNIGKFDNPYIKTAA